MKLSIIVTTYNQPRILNAALGALARQRHAGDYEVLVADDGSTPETAALVAEWATRFPCPLKHVWHEDKGFRAGAIRNRAAAQAAGDYLVFLDGDCIVLPDFCERHRQLAEAGWCVAGSRVLLSESYTPTLLQSAAPWEIVEWSAREWRQASQRGWVNKATAYWRLPLGPLRKLQSANWKRVRTCNVGVMRQDFEAVNGFDEAFTGWGFEDSDFAIRLIRAGTRIKDGRFSIPVLHLWHKENDRSKQQENWAKLEVTLNGSHTRAQLGVDQYHS